jgi:hypothetical protein
MTDIIAKLDKHDRSCQTNPIAIRETGRACSGLLKVGQTPQPCCSYAGTQ